MIAYIFLFFFKQKTAYEMRISDWSSDVCSSDLAAPKSPSLPWSAPATTEVVTEDRNFASGDAELSGTLLLPVSGKPVAAIVVTHSAPSPLRSASLSHHLQTIQPALGLAALTYHRRAPDPSGSQAPGGSYDTPPA